MICSRERRPSVLCVVYREAQKKRKLGEWEMAHVGFNTLNNSLFFRVV